MHFIFTLLQVFLAIAMYDVWLFRYRTPGCFRGGDSTTMEEEFKVYGLSDSFRRLVRVLKLSAGTLMVVGIWVDFVALVAGVLLSILMLGAMIMHFKVKDPLYKAFPATSFFLMSLLVAYAHLASINAFL
jgi:hypothetical protein